MEQKYFRIACVIVTYNRLELLKKCISSVRNQSYKPDKIIVINNSSTDGTEEWLKSQNDLTFITQENSGSAGGQYTGIKTAYEKGYDWIWTMDDDVITTTSALKNLVEKILYLDSPGYLTSNVISKNGNMTNVPIIDKRKSKIGYQEWNKFLDKSCVRIREATFVSILINREAIKLCGFPLKKFFIWGDDYEYTLRLSQRFNGYLVGDSIVYHLRYGSENFLIAKEKEAGRIKQYFYFYRNSVFIMKKYYSLLFSINYIYKIIFVEGIIMSLKSHDKVYLKLFTIFRGFLSGIFFYADEN